MNLQRELCSLNIYNYINKIKSILIVLFLFQYFISVSQNFNSNSEYLFEYGKLEEQLKKLPSKIEKNNFLQSSLEIFKSRHDTLNIAEAYYYLSEINTDTHLAIKYADSIILTTKKINHPRYPAYGYYRKGVELYYSTQLNEALHNYMLAKAYFEKNEKNDLDLLKIRSAIALLKNLIGEEKEALDLFKLNDNFFNSKKNKERYKRQYLLHLFSLADSYSRNKLLDSSEVINKLGIKESLISKNEYLYNLFLVSYGTNRYLKGDYDIALDSLLKGIKHMPDNESSLPAMLIHVGNIYKLKNDEQKFLQYMNKVDSIYSKNPFAVFEARDVYEELYSYYKTKSNVKKQIEIVDKLLKSDSIIKNQYSDLSKNIVRGYEVQELIKDKEKLILKLNKEKQSLSTFYVLLIFICIILISIIMLRYILLKKKNGKLLKAYKENLKRINEKKNESKNSLDKIPESVVKSILIKLERFEKSEKFTSKKYTINSLAKELKTNANYLSKIINISKNMSFANYLNNLKIELIIKKLNEEKHFKNYTLKALSQEAGFNNTQTFTSAFVKKMGETPVEYIKTISS